MPLEIPEENMDFMMASEVWDTEGKQEDESEKWRENRTFILWSGFAYISLGPEKIRVFMGLVVETCIRPNQECQLHLL